MSARTKLPISPAPRTSPRYPRVGAVWGAFAAGTLGLAPAIAHADCALPAHSGTVDPGATDKGKGKKPKPEPVVVRPALPGKIIAPRPLVGGEPMPVAPPGTRIAPRPPVPGGEVPVAPPSGGPVHVVPPQPPGKAAPKREQLDGDVAHVESVRYIHIHAHGPDEPCLPPGSAPLVLRFT